MCNWIGSVVLGTVVGLLIASLVLENVTGGTQDSFTIFTVPVSVDLNLGLFQSCLDVKASAPSLSTHSSIVPSSILSFDSPLPLFKIGNNPTTELSSELSSQSTAADSTSLYHYCSSLPISSTSCDWCFTLTIGGQAFTICNPLYEDDNACKRFQVSRGLFLSALALSGLAFLLVFGYSIAECCCSNTSAYYSVNRGRGGVYTAEPDYPANYNPPSNVRAYMLVQSGSGRSRALTCGLFSAFLSSILLAAGLVLIPKIASSTNQSGEENDKQLKPGYGPSFFWWLVASVLQFIFSLLLCCCIRRTPPSQTSYLPLDN